MGQHGQELVQAKPQEVAQALQVQLTALRDRVWCGADLAMVNWLPRIQRPEFISSAANMADWLALRQVDLTPLQAPLTRLGLSTLGRLEGHVRASMDAVIAALTMISGGQQAEFPDPAIFAAGEAVLAARRDEIFGDQMQVDPQTRIMVTLPTESAGDDGLLIRRLVAAGLDCFRINCAHDTPEVWAAMIDQVRRTEAETGLRLPVSMDLGGPKFRVVKVSSGKDKKLFTPGDRFALAGRLSDGPKGMFCATLSHAALLAALLPAAMVSIDDGKLWARVVKVATGHAVLEVTRAPAKGARIKPEKGVNLPGSDLRVDALTADDLVALDFVVGHADIVSFSFVQTVADVQALIAALHERLPEGGGLPAIILKIETPLGLRNLPELIVEAGGATPVGVMIARGDLAVEIGFERLSEIQEEILWLCEAAQVPVIWATQVLEGMVKDGQASRAEVTDAAMSQRAECVMLNKGPHVVEAVAFLRGILGRMDRHQTKKAPRLGPLHVWASGD
ncbi:MAG: pyruvate kinase [Paracoccaceae bacterium]|nr:pyruvate kinase [Paracoccaceae bacterium]